MKRKLSPPNNFIIKVLAPGRLYLRFFFKILYSCFSIIFVFTFSFCLTVAVRACSAYSHAWIILCLCGILTICMKSPFPIFYVKWSLVCISVFWNHFELTKGFFFLFPHIIMIIYLFKNSMWHGSILYSNAARHNRLKYTQSNLLTII